MQLTHKNILIISPEPWGTSFVSKHHYAIELAKKGNNVYFLNPPSTAFDIEFLQDVGLHLLHYKPRFRGLGRMPHFLSAYLTALEFSNLEKKVNVTFDIIWNFDSSRFFNLKRIRRNVLKIQHIVDLSENFQRNLGAATSDICFSTTDFIAAEQQLFNKNVFKIHHGSHREIDGNAIPLGIEIKETIKVGYVGNLSIKYLDWKLILEAVQQNSDVGFVFIGPIGKSNLSNALKIDPFLLKVQTCANAYFLGPKPAAEIPSLLLNFDILLVAYKVNEYREQLASPHKFMEYFSAGKVILTTFTDEYKNNRTLLEMVDNPLELPQRLAQIKYQLNVLNDAAHVAERLKFAEDNSYAKQLERIENLLSQHCKE